MSGWRYKGHTVLPFYPADRPYQAGYRWWVTGPGGTLLFARTQADMRQRISESIKRISESTR